MSPKAKSPPISERRVGASVKVREGLDQADRLVESFSVLARAERGVIDDLTTVSLPQVTADALDARAEPCRRSQRDLAAESRGGGRSRQPNTPLPPGRQPDRQRHQLQPARRVGAHHDHGGRPIRPVDRREQRSCPRSGRGRPAGPAVPASGAERTGSDGGVGLGLSIVAAIAAAHHGTVELEHAHKEGCGWRSSFLSPSRPSPARAVP